MQCAADLCRCSMTDIGKMAALKFAAAAAVITLGTLTVNALFRKSSVADGADERGHVLTALWSEYDKAVSADRPKQQAEVLSLIKEEAGKRHLAWDFYDAAEKYFSAETGRNWKLRDSLVRRFEKEVRSFSEPVMTFTWMIWHSDCNADSILGYVQDNAEALKSGMNRGFYSLPGFRYRVSGQADFLKHFYANDYEYAMWMLLYDGYELNDRVFRILREYEGESVPSGAYMDYLQADDMPSDTDAEKSARKKALEDVSGKYAGKSVSMFPRAELLRMKFDSLNRGKAPGEEYERLYNECASFEAERDSYKGDEALIVRDIEYVRSLSEQLTGESVTLHASASELKVLLRNVPEVNVKFRKEGDDKGKALLDKSLKDTVRSFYVQDTLTVDIPPVDDGEYRFEAKSGKVIYTEHYGSHRISLAKRTDSRGICIYAADWKSGEPLRKADLKLTKNGRVIAEYKGFVFNGFTPLPDMMDAKVEGNAYMGLSCSCIDDNGYVRSSTEVGLRGGAYTHSDAGRHAESLCGEIFTDRGAYNPGDTMDFKAVLYRTDHISSASVADAGLEVNVTLTDAEGKEIQSMSLKTNEFGSVSGEFTLPVGARNGWFGLSVEMSGEEKGHSLCHRRLRVDEFVLPTFDVSFDKMDRLYFPGDSVRVSGRVTSYAGHPVSSSNASYRVVSYGDEVASGVLTLNRDGTFAVTFTALAHNGLRSYNVEVRISDDTGETHEYGMSVMVTGRIAIDIDLENAAEGQVSKICADSERHSDEYAEVQPLSEEKAMVRLSVSSYDGKEPPLDIDYNVVNESGKEISRGAVRSGAVAEVDLSDYPSGLYKVRATAMAVSSAGEEYADTSELMIFLLRDDDAVIDAPVRDVIVSGASEVGDGHLAGLVFGMADGCPAWACADVFGSDGELLESRMVRLSGRRGEEGSLLRLSFPYKDDYPDAIRVQMFYFRNGSKVSWSHEYRRVRSERVLPLEFSAFEDKTLPSSPYTFAARTGHDVECLAAVFDKSTEVISANSWDIFRLNDFHVSTVGVSARVGTVGSYGGFDGLSGNNAIFGRSHKLGVATRSAALMLPEEESAEEVMDYAADYEAAAFAASGMEDDLVEQAAIREKFSNTLAFIPFLRPDKDGVVSFSFNTSDKLSTYCVSLYAHDKSMCNAVLRRDMMVTIPARVSVTEPKYLYDNDSYRLAAAVSSVCDEDISGTVSLSVYPCGRYADVTESKVSPLTVQRRPVTVPAGGSVKALFDVDVAALCRMCAELSGNEKCADATEEACGPDGGCLDTLGFKIMFVADGTFSDGIFVAVPILPAAQTLEETHSAVLLAGADKEQVLKNLRNEFVNTEADEADLKEISILGMLRDALPSKVEPQGEDILSLSEAYYVRAVAAYLREGFNKEECASCAGLTFAAGTFSDTDLFGKILACRNADGGFGWFEGMKSSPVITSVVLERFAKMSVAGLMDLGLDICDGLSSGASGCSAADGKSAETVAQVIEAAVKYLDAMQFSGPGGIPLWCGGLSDRQYMYIRSMFPSVKFDVDGIIEGSGTSSKEIDGRIRDFRKDAEKYLVPKRERGLDGYVLDKARRTATLRNLLRSKDGIALAKSWGAGISADRKLAKSVDADIVSLLEYAVDHKDGGVYYPNAVMPFRGLLESEVYAHSLLCDLLSDYASDGTDGSSHVSAMSGHAASVQAHAEAQRIADGIRIWLMLQKETQHWDTDPAFMDAVNSVMKGSEEVKATSVIVLSGTYTKPFEDVKSAGNGFTIERKFFREVPESKGSADNAGPSVSVRPKEAGTSPALVELKSGDALSVGEKIIAKYLIHNDENRSFVKVTVPREAAFRPVDQLSGNYGMRAHPLRISGRYSVSPQGYRNVKAAVTEYYFDVCPEEDMEIREELFVTQAGVFHSPVPEVESLYAPHYRANGSSSHPLSSK